MLSSPLPTINALKQPTNDAWVEQAIANIDMILLDHSHCERKAAGVALNMMFRYPSHHKMIRELTAIACEELEHFELVNQWLERRQIKLAALSAPPYGAAKIPSSRPRTPQIFRFFTRHRFDRSP